MISHKEIKPKHRGKSDFFSWQLYKWIRSKPYHNQVWLGTWNSIEGVNKRHQSLYIGFMDNFWFHGRQIRNLCRYGQDLQSYAYGPGHDTQNWECITDEWWSKYMREGVCAIHGDLVHSWIKINSHARKCAYCGKHEHREVYTQRHYVRKELWA